MCITDRYHEQVRERIALQDPTVKAGATARWEPYPPPRTPHPPQVSESNSIQAKPHGQGRLQCPGFDVHGANSTLRTHRAHLQHKQGRTVGAEERRAGLRGIQAASTWFHPLRQPPSAFSIGSRHPMEGMVYKREEAYGPQ